MTGDFTETTVEDYPDQMPTLLQGMNSTPADDEAQNGSSDEDPSPGNEVGSESDAD